MTAARRALLIGCQTHGLEGVEGDVERMSTALHARHFELSRCLGSDATRDGIIAAYEKLIADTRPGEAVCVYYSGHGGRVPNPYPVGPELLQYLVPTDHEGGVFRGVMSFELSSLLARLTAKSPNVTVILDCCHAGQMSRGDAAQKIGEMTLTPKVFAGEVSEAELRALLDRVNAERVLADVESNPHALRLVATEPQCSAYEGKLRNVSSGIFTSALLEVLEKSGDRPASWGSVILQVRERVIALKKEQRPDVEGPRRRELWGLSLFPDERPLSVFFSGTQARLRGGALFGAVPGARFGVMPAGSEKYVAGEALGEAVVVESDGSTSPVDIHAKGPNPLAVPGLVAFPLGEPEGKCQVGLGPELSPEIGGVFANSRYLTPVPIEPGARLPTIRMAGAHLVLRDASGLVLASEPEARVADVLERLEILSRAEALRAFSSGLLDAELNVELGRVVGEERIRMTPSEPLCVGDRQYISVTNDGLDPVYVAVFGIDPRYTVRLLSRRAPRGLRLRPNESLPLGRGADGKWVGYEVSLPDGVAPDEPLRETIVVIAAEDEQDFPLLTTADAYDLKLAEAQSAARGAAPARGQRGFAEGPRAVGSEYKLLRFDYLLSPKPR